MECHTIVISAACEDHTMVIPAKAGIHVTRQNMDYRFRGNDRSFAGMTVASRE
jgi:hypothetical protein